MLGGDASVLIRLLGPVEVMADDVVWPVGPPQRRCLLALLAVHAGHLLTTESLIDRVWDEHPPAAARRAVHAHITRLRQTLAEAGIERRGGRLVSRSGGYLLDVDPHLVDLHRFRHLVTLARAGDCPDTRRVELLDQALRLVRGEPLSGLAGSWADQAREAWRREQADTMVAWANAELRLNGPAGVIVPVTTMLTDHPLYEPLAAVLVRALHAAGRTAEALEWYTTISTRLVDELGADPGPELAAAHVAVLRGEVAPAAVPSHGVAPAQLPGAARGFVGRDAELAALDAILDTAGSEPTAVVISAVSGTAGVGKTALAVHWAHRVADRFPDGQMYVNLRAFDAGGRVMSVAEALRIFLDALGVAPERTPSELDAQIGLYRSLMNGRRLLVVVDNARDADQVRPLLPGSPTAVVVVTSRNQLTPLVATDGAHSLALDVLSAEESRALLAGRLGAERIAAESDAANRILAACAGLPLALAVAAARAEQSGFPLLALAAELDDAGKRLDVLDAGDPTSQVRAVMSWSYQGLTPMAARLFRLLGLHAGPDISLDAAASLAGSPRPDTRRLLAELGRASLLTEHVPGRYAFHDLLRVYASDLARDLENDDTRSAALTRLLDHYTHTAYAASRLLKPRREPIEIPLAVPATGTTVEAPAAIEQALSWLVAERRVLLMALESAAESAFDTHAWQLTWALDALLDRLGHYEARAAAWQIALRAARRLGDPTAEACAHRRLGSAAAWFQRYDEAARHLHEALRLSVRTGDRVGQGEVHHNLAILCSQQDKPHEALDHAERALALFEAADHPRGVASGLNDVGWCHAVLGNYAQTLAYSQRALSEFQRLDDREGVAATWDSIGYAHHRLGNHARAVDCYQRSLELLREIGDREMQAIALTHLGEIHEAADDAQAAKGAWQSALAILTELDHPEADTVREKLAAVEHMAATAARG